MDVLQRLLHDPVDRELGHRSEPGVLQVKLTGHFDAATGLPFGRVVADRFGETELAELGWPEVVDHRAHRIERPAELALEVRELGLEGLTHLGRSTLGDALEVLDLEDRVREHLSGTVVHVAVETLSLGLEAAEHALCDLHRLVVGIRRWIDPRTEEIGGARLDVLDHKLQLLETPVTALGLFVELAVRRLTRTVLSAFLIGATVLFDLLPEIA